VETARVRDAARRRDSVAARGARIASEAPASNWNFHALRHTAKFHVAAILAKLDADSRTEAVAKAAQLGLVML